MANFLSRYNYGETFLLTTIQFKIILNSLQNQHTGRSMNKGVDHKQMADGAQEAQIKVFHNLK